MATSQLFSTASGSKPAQSKPAAPAKSAPVDLPLLQNASRVLAEQMAKDATIIPDLGECLTGSGSQATASYSIFADDLRTPFQKRKFVGIPEALFQYYDTANVTSHMGLLPEIERVWISIDHKLFLWDYIDGQEIASFVDQPDVITHVALVRPKAGVFVEDITSILVICTPISVLLIGVSVFIQPGLDNKPRREIKLYATDLSIATDVEMASVIGTADGRIFMCGQQDGNLYEFHYQERESWFGKRVQLINHSVGGVQSLLPRFASTPSDERIVSAVSDIQRNCFYTLSSKSTISMYTTSGDKSIQHIQTLSSIHKAAQDKAPASPAITPKTWQLISIHVIQPSESRNGLQLLAINSNGVRLFFGPSLSYGYGYPSGQSSSSLRPIQLIHVRLPPLNLIHPDEQARLLRATPSLYGVTPSHQPPTSRPHTVNALDNSAYIDGLLVSAQPGDTEGTDYLLCLAPDLTRVGNLGQTNIPPAPSQPSHSFNYSTGATSTRPPLTEYATLLPIPGRTWGMAALAAEGVPTPPGVDRPSSINELATQFDELPHQFIILTNVGLTFLVKRRAVDYLRAVLEEFHTESNAQPIVEFRDSFGRDQTCAMLLGLASGNTYLGPTENAGSGVVTSISPELAAVAKQAFYDFGERPIWTERMTYGKPAENKGTAIFSGRREGFALYFARLVRPIWKLKVVTTHTAAPALNAPEKLLVDTQNNLSALRDFLARNPHLFHSAPSDMPSTRVAEQEAWKAEQSSVAELQTLLVRTIEALSFILLLSDYRLGELILKCEPEVQKLAATITFEELVTGQQGMTLSRALVNIVIDQQIGQQLSVDVISDVLQNRCGSFCSTDDVMLYKAKENVRKSAETKNPNERQKYLAEALRLFTKGARNLEFEKLREVIGDFQQLSFAQGAVNLPLICAQIQDPDNKGLECWHAGLPAGDARLPLAELRSMCYALILDSLSVFESKCSPQDANSGATSEAEATRSHAYELAFASEDEMFHSTLYDWLIERNLADDLLEMRPVYLEAHLRRQPTTVQKLQLLWQFYVKNGQPLRAAEVLATLAESSTLPVHLETRIEYLTLAVANAKSHPISPEGRHETAIAFLTDLEEKLDVAQVQLEIYNTLLPHVNDAPEVGERIESLSKQLFTMTELYQRFAVPFDLSAIKLLCLHVSEHRDETLARSIWKQIFDEILQETEDPEKRAELIRSRVVPLGQRFYPSESSFPVRHIARMLVQFLLTNHAVLPAGWVSRLLIDCGVQYTEIWETLHEMYESEVPPFNTQANVQIVSTEIAVLLTDWVAAATRPQANALRREFPAGRVDEAVEQYLKELSVHRTETKNMYEEVKRTLRRHW